MTGAWNGIERRLKTINDRRTNQTGDPSVKQMMIEKQDIRCRAPDVLLLQYREFRRNSLYYKNTMIWE